MFLFPLTPSGWRLHFKAKVLFKQIMAQSRAPVFYTDYAVPDTIDGRFEMIALHTGLVINRVRYEGKTGTRLAQSLFDEMFLNMEISCRQIGIGDLSVSKHIKRMMVALQGRALHYEDAAKQGQGALAETLKRNLYGTTQPPEDAALKDMADYVLACQAKLQSQAFENLVKGSVEFAPLPQAERYSSDKTSQVA